MAMNTPSLSFGTNIKSSFTFPARPPPTQQQAEEQQQRDYRNNNSNAQAGPSTISPSQAEYRHQLPQQNTFHHAQQPSLSSFSRKSSGSASSVDPFAYDRASLRATASSSSSGTNNRHSVVRHTPSSSLASLGAFSITSPSIAASADCNKELPPAPEYEISPVKSGTATASTLTATASSSRAPSPSPPSSSVHSAAPPVVAYVQALHDYVATPDSANICLSFTAGQLIKVLNRDASGWWDGEIEGTRGWFPSNYVAQDPVDLSHLANHATSSQAYGGSAVASTSSEPMQRAFTTPATMMSISSLSSNSRPDSPAFDPTRRPSSQDTVTSAVTHAIHLMQTAVDANRLSHFRPASACFVVAVKSILHATDTLAKDSVILRTHLVLARQRKQILSNLANVMTMARTASSPEHDYITRARETSSMLQAAHAALNNVENFLSTAMQCGVDVPSQIETNLNDEQAQRISSMQTVSTPNLDACLQFTADPNDMAFLSTKSSSSSSSSHKATSSSSSLGKSLHKTRSMSDMKQGSRRKMSEVSNTSSGTSSSHGATAAQQYAFLEKPPSPTDIPRRPTQQNVRRPSIPAAYATSMPGPLWQANDSISSSVSSLNSSQGASTPIDINTPQQPADVYRTLATIHDQLLSTIAAFIGHVHAHSRTSHSSSYAHLIDMTRETIERVRETLLIVDVIAAHPALSSFTRDLKYLGKFREALYMATTGLVTAARQATAPLASDLTDEGLIHDQEEEEKQELLKAATGVLRASADCVNSTKPLLLRRRASDAAFVIDLQQSSSSDLSRSSSGSTEAPPDEDATVQVTDSGIGSEENTNIGGIRDGEKARHTVSMLVRKGANLVGFGEDQYKSDESHLGDVSFNSSMGDEYEDADENQQYRSESRAEDLWSEQYRHSTRSQPSSARNSFSSSRPGTPSMTDRSESSLSTRRGMPIPPNLQIQTRGPALKARPPSVGSTSAASTVTLLSREKVVVPVGSTRMARTYSEPKSAGSHSSASSDSYKAGGEAMSRDESSRGSATSTTTSSFRSVMSEANTADTSPRTSWNCASPADDKVEWLFSEPGTTTTSTSRRPSRTDALRARSGSTPDRVAALRISEGLGSQLISPLSPRSPYQLPQPDTSTSKNWLLERDYEPKECCFNADGNVTGGTLRCLIERMTLHDQTIDGAFASTFYLTFRMFTTPMELAEILFARFNITAPAVAVLSEVEVKIWREQKLTPVRLRIYNFLKAWLESHWRPETDAVILEPLLNFTRETMMPVMPAAAQRLIDLIQKRAIVTSTPENGRVRVLTRMASTEKLKAGKPVTDGVPLNSATSPGPGSCLPPPPIMSKGLINALRTPPYAPNSILDFDPLELARQFTIMESRLYCAILPEDLIGQDFSKKGSNRSSNIRAMSTLSTRITGWIAEIILDEHDAKKRSGLVKYFIKLGDRCMHLQNYNTLMAILAALNSSTISRLKKTWEGLSNKHKATLEILRKNTEHTRNYALYRATIRSAVAPCLPFLGLTLTDLTFCQDGNSADRPSPLDSSLRLINFDRYQKIAKIINDVQRFQVAYNLIEVPEIQSFLQNALKNVEHGGDPQALYRRSLMVEPRENTAEHHGMPQSAGLKDAFNWRI